MPPFRTQDPSPDDQDGDGPAIDLIRRWIELSELERRVFVALAHELTVSSELIEVSTIGLSERFQALAAIAEAQMSRMDRIIAAARTIDVDGETMTLDAALLSVQGGIGQAIGQIQRVSRDAGRMVHALEGLARDIAAMEACAASIGAVNQPVEMRARIAAASGGIRDGIDALRDLASIDLSESVALKDRIDSLIAGLSAQDAAFHAVLRETAESSAEMGATIGRLVHGMQFQDRTKQHLTQVIDTLSALGEGTVEAQKATTEAYPGLFRQGKFDDGLLAQLIEKQRLGDMKVRMLARLLTDADSVATGPAEATGDDIELF